MISILSKYNTVLPFTTYRYLELNVRYSSSYRAYNQDIPAFLLNRPRELVMHCMMRLDAGKSIPKSNILLIDPKNGCFQVQSQSRNQTYNLNFGSRSSMPHCDCLDWRNNYLPCKHFLSIFYQFPKWNWETFPAEYKDSPLLNLDTDLAQSLSEAPQNETGSGHQENIDADDNDHNSTTLDDYCCSDDDASTSDVLPLPRKKLSPQSEAAKVREVLNEIRSLSFLVHDSRAISDLHSTLRKAMEEFRTHTTSEAGIDLEINPVPTSTKVNATKVNQSHCMKTPNQKHDLEESAVRPLPSNTKSRHKYSGRVGEVAATMKKMYKVSTSVNDLIEKDNDAVTITSRQQSTNNEVEQMVVDLAFDGVHQAAQTIDGENDEVIFLKAAAGKAAKRKLRRLGTQDIAIIKNGKILTDNAINIAQNILHNQYPLIAGLEDTVLGTCFNFSIVRGEFVQVLHDGALHWVCVSNVGCKEDGCVNVYDSLNKGKITLHMKKQVASMLFHRGPVIKLNVQQVQQQDNSVDCGVFAVAYATSILHGQNPEDLNYDTCSLRQHLLTCISSGIFTPFPLSNQPHSKSKKKTLKLKLFCSCRMPWDAADEEIPEKQMAQCDSCKKWYHRSCEKIPELVYSANCFWKCTYCSTT